MTERAEPFTFKAIAEWIVPALLAAAVAVLLQMSGDIKAISTSLAVAVVRVDLHDKELIKQAGEIEMMREADALRDRRQDALELTIRKR